MTEAIVALAPVNGMTAATCAALGVSRASVQRRRARLIAPALDFLWFVHPKNVGFGRFADPDL